MPGVRPSTLRKHHGSDVRQRHGGGLREKAGRTEVEGAVQSHNGVPGMGRGGTDQGHSQIHSGKEEHPSRRPQQNGLSDTAYAISLKVKAFAFSIGTVSPRRESSLEKNGYLIKLGGKLKTWKKRYFVLKEGTLTYWKSQSDIHRKPAGQITLNEVCRVTHSEGAHTFEVNTGKKTYYLTADNTALVEDWVRVLQNVLRRNANKSYCLVKKTISQHFKAG
ncbi:pleckstrin homology domain-containing family A member 1-like [Palaemon carinicauda]|uniref:pleckstrin homology domain-containing family A member 1-like n=1 Tax=Palaemon carinicauda TaxID=392227 RepID=UPI0035B6719B